MALFPDIAPSYDYTMTVNYKTLTSFITDGDIIQRRRKRTTPLHAFNLKYNLLTETDEKTLFDFYTQRYGSWESFSMFDFKERSWSGQTIGTGDGAEDTFDSGVKTISAYTISISGVVQVEGGGSDYTVNATAGTDGQAQVVFNGGSEPTLAARIDIQYTGYKYFATCVFENDTINRSLFLYNLYRLGLNIIEVTS